MEWLVLCSVSLTCVAMGDVDAEIVDELRAKLKSLFTAVRNGISLTGALIVALVTFYSTVMMVENVEEVSINDPDELEEAAAEAWQHTHSFDLPRAQIVRVRKWAVVGRRGGPWLQGAPGYVGT